MKPFPDVVVPVVMLSAVVLIPPPKVDVALLKSVVVALPLLSEKMVPDALLSVVRPATLKLLPAMTLPVAVKAPFTVEDDCETKPEVNVCNCDQMLVVVVPKAVEMVIAPVAPVVRSGYVAVSDVTPAEPPPTQVPLILKQPVVMLKPTLEVEVAEPVMLRPVRVVVPKPIPETVRADVEAEVTASKMLPVALPQRVSLEYAEEVPMPRLVPLKTSDGEEVIRVPSK